MGNLPREVLVEQHKKKKSIGKRPKEIGGEETESMIIYI